MQCPVCGQAELVHAIRDLPYSYKGQIITILQVEADWCGACGESITGPEESEHVMQAMAKHKTELFSEL